MKVFPCWVCKGSGIGEKGESIDVGGEGYVAMMQISPDIECGYCEGRGMLEVDGEIHTKRKLESIALKAISYFKPKKEEWTYEEIITLGKKIRELLKSQTPI